MRTSSSLENKISSDILKSSASIYEISSHSFRTTTWIQSGPDTFDKSRLALTFLTNFEVAWILYSFRLVLEGKVGEELLVSSTFMFLEKYIVNRSPLSEVDGNASGQSNRGGPPLFNWPERFSPGIAGYSC